MAVTQAVSSPARVAVDARWEHKRRRRWSFFQTFFGLTYLGILCDLGTTALGFQKMGSSYEQNPLGLFLIGHLGWLGLGLLVTALCAFCYLSVRVVYWRMSTVWSAIINPAMFTLAVFRWLVVSLAIAYLVSPTH